MPKAASERDRAVRRQRVAQMVNAGLSDRKIGFALHIAPKTVKRDRKVLQVEQDEIMGHTTLLSEIVRHRIVSAVTAGIPIMRSANLVGVSDRTITQWLTRGSQALSVREETGTVVKSEVPYLQLYTGVTQARAMDVSIRVGRISRHAEKDWRADMKLLEKVHAGDFGSGAQQAQENVKSTAELNQSEIVRQAYSIVADSRRQIQPGPPVDSADDIEDVDVVASVVDVSERDVLDEPPDDIDTELVTEPATPDTQDDWKAPVAIDRSPPVPDPYTEQPLRGDAEQ